MDKKQQINFDVLYKGEQRISQIEAEVILIMGQTRAGKSCLCNHIRERRMVGKKDDNSLTHFIPSDNDDNTYARMGDEYTSITLDPNIYQLTNGKSLIDAAGFDQNRDTAGVMAVSYFLESLFSKLKKVKFMLVFNESVVYNRNPQNITDTFDDFISLFNLSAMTKDVRNQLMTSVSIVVTHSSKSNEEYLKSFQNISDRLGQGKQLRNIKFQDTIVEMIKNVVDGKRINSFKMAEAGVEVSKNSFLPDLEKTNWSLFDCELIKATLKDRLIILPFERDFQLLRQEEQKQFKNALKERGDLVTSGFAKVIQIYRDSLISNWKEASKDRKKLGNKFADKALNSSVFFKEVSAFLAKTFSTYNLKELTEKVQFKTSFSTPKLLEVIFSTQKLVDDFQEVENNDNTHTIQEKIEIFSKQIPLMIEEMVSICSNKEQYEMLKKMTFVMRRAIHEYFTFYKIKKDLLHDFHIKLKDDILNALSRRNVYIEEICNSMDTELLNLLFTKIPELDIFDKFIEEYIDDLRTNPGEKVNYDSKKIKYESNFQEVKMSIATSKFDISTKDPSPLVTLTHLVNLLAETFVTVRKLNELNPSAESKSRCETFELKNVKYCKMASTLLMKHDSKNIVIAELAVELSELTRCPYSTQIIYQQILTEQESNIPNLLNFLEKYSKFLIKWGRIEQAIQVLLRKKHLYLNTDNFTGIKTVEKDIQDYQKNTPTILEQRNALLKRLSQPLNNKENEDLEKILVRISSKLNNVLLKEAVQNFKKKRAVPVPVVPVPVVPAPVVPAPVQAVKPAPESPQKK